MSDYLNCKFDKQFNFKMTFDFARFFSQILDSKELTEQITVSKLTMHNVTAHAVFN